MGATRYTNAVGIPELRAALAAFYRARYATEVDADQIVITPGASGALQLALGVLIDPGERVLMADPGYPCNRHFVRFVNGDALPIAVGADSGYQLTAELVERHWTADTAAVMVASPSNPTGTLIPRSELEAIAGVVKQRGGRLIVDEIYQGLTYEESEQTVLTLDDQAFVVNSFSKYFGMTGWRLGWLVVPEGYLTEVTKLAQNLFVSPSAVAQYAALAAFEPATLDILETRRHEFGRRRNFLLEGLQELGFRISRRPEGAFYLYADCTTFSQDSQRFAVRLLEESGVAITPGIDFGEHRAGEHVRFAYTTSMEQLQQGLARIGEFLDSIADTGERQTAQT
jgi:aspartate/methionine/tyrosine aminotransferase